jgi:D-cysteine desulfhydrase
MRPERLSIANLPTKVEELTCFSKDFRQTLYIKRDDQTGIEFSGNKIRKLEYAVKEALEQGADTLITCGGIQSNHCRTTAATAAKLGLKSILLLRSDNRAFPQGNHLLDQLLGAFICWVTSGEYARERMQRMEKIAKRLKSEGRKGYILPEGASNAIGTFGYFHAFEEILEQEKELNINFDTVVCAVGSGGTYAGLVFGNQYYKSGKKIIGVNICDDAEHFREIVMSFHEPFCELLGDCFDLSKEQLHLLDGYVGRGYALNTPQEMDFLAGFAKRSGIVLDPVYTGKAMNGLFDALGKNHSLLKDSENILFIHTGGLYGVFPKAGEFDFQEND